MYPRQHDPGLSDYRLTTCLLSSLSLILACVAAMAMGIVLIALRGMC